MMSKMKLFFAAAMLALLSQATVAAEENGAQSVRVEVNGMVCAFCAQGIRRTFDREPATADILVSLENRLVAIEFKPGMEISDEKITDHLTDAGYDVVAITRVAESVESMRGGLSGDG